MKNTNMIKAQIETDEIVSYEGFAAKLGSMTRIKRIRTPWGLIWSHLDTGETLGGVDVELTLAGTLPDRGDDDDTPVALGYFVRPTAIERAQEIEAELARVTD